MDRQVVSSEEAFWYLFHASAQYIMSNLVVASNMRTCWSQLQHSDISNQSHKFVAEQLNISFIAKTALSSCILAPQKHIIAVAVTTKSERTPSTTPRKRRVQSKALCRRLSLYFMKLRHVPHQLFCFGDDSHRRDARHSHPCEETHRLRIKFVLYCPICAFKLENQTS